MGNQETLLRIHKRISSFWYYTPKRVSWFPNKTKGKVTPHKTPLAATSGGTGHFVPLAPSVGRYKWVHADAFGLRLEAYQRAPALTKFRLQLETLEDVLPGMRKFVRPGAGDVKDIDIWLLQPIGSGQSK